MNIVYIVTNGTYSDYGIVRIFSDLNKAEAYLESQKKISDDNARIEEWPVDDDTTEIAKRLWRTDINLITGRIENYETERYGWATPEQRVGPSTNMSHIPYVTGFVPTTVYFESFVSQEHANKLAVEGRQEFLRRIDPSLLKQREGKFINYFYDHPDYK